MLRPVPLALLFILFALLTPAASHAASPAGWEYGRAAAVALRVWQGQVPCTELSIVRDAPGATAPGGASTAGFWGYVMTAPDGRPAEPCTLHLTADAQAQAWPAICTTVLHEVGHLAGRQHTVHGLMAPVYEQPDPRCAHRGRPVLGLPEPKLPADRIKFASVRHLTS